MKVFQACRTPPSESITPQYIMLHSWKVFHKLVEPDRRDLLPIQLHEH